MPGPHQPFSSGELKSAIAALRTLPNARETIIKALNEIEMALPLPTDVNIREEITGPITDTLFEKDEIISKSLANGLLFDFRYSSKIARDFVMARPEAPDHVWEPQTTKLLKKLARPDGHAVFGGAYFGDQAVIVADFIKPNGICHCFELSNENANLLRINAGKNNLSNVLVNTLGLWSTDDVALVLVGDDSHAYARPTLPGEFGLETTSIDSYGRRHAIEKIDVISLDLEGGELSALRGAESYLRQAPNNAPAIVFEIHRSYSDWSDGLDNTDIARYLASLGYTLFAIRDYQSNVEMRGLPIELIPSHSVYLEGPPHGFNMLASKDLSIIEASDIQIVQDVSPKLLFHRDPRLHQPLTKQMSPKSVNMPR